MVSASAQSRLDDFRARCADAGLAATHQRFVIYRPLVESTDHPSPELVYGRVRADIPSISQATVYKNIHTFVDIGLLREINRLHQTNRLDANLDQHHHLICVRCEKITDLYDDPLDGARAREELPGGFEVLNYQVEAYGVCPDCQSPKAASSAQ
jgi:Fur family peroxide stress response transcriptional regulator